MASPQETTFSQVVAHHLDRAEMRLDCAEHASRGGDEGYHLREAMRSLAAGVRALARAMESR